MAWLHGFGYELSQGGKTGGSRVCFTHATAPAINVHRPHPTPILKRYLIEQVAEAERGGATVSDMVQHKGYYGSVEYTNASKADSFDPAALVSP